MSFIKVTANQCNQQGTSNLGQPAIEFYLNIDLVLAIHDDTIQLNGSEMINLDGKWYRNIRLAQGTKIAGI